MRLVMQLDNKSIYISSKFDWNADCIGKLTIVEHGPYRFLPRFREHNIQTLLNKL